MAVRRSGDRWSVEFQQSGERVFRRLPRFATKADAVDHITATSADLLRGDYISETDRRTTFGEYANAWRTAQIHRPSSAGRTETLIRVHMGRWHSRPLGSIRPTEVQAWVRHLGDTLAPATVASIYQLFATIMRAAVTDRLVNASPCVRIQTPRAEHRHVVPLPLEVVVGLADELARGEMDGGRVVKAFAARPVGRCDDLGVCRAEDLRNARPGYQQDCRFFRAVVSRQQGHFARGAGDTRHF